MVTRFTTTTTCEMQQPTYRLKTRRRVVVRKDAAGCNRTWLAVAVIGIAILAITITAAVVAITSPSTVGPPAPVMARAKGEDPNGCTVGETWNAPLGMCLPHVITPSAVDTSIINYNISACDGFFEHACGRWIHAHENEDRAFTAIAKRNRFEVDQVITSSSGGADGVSAFYDSCSSTMVDRHSGRANQQGHRARELRRQQQAHLRESALERNYILAKMMRKLVHLSDVPETLALMTAHGFTIPFHVEIANHPTKAELLPMLQWDGFITDNGDATTVMQHVAEHHFRSVSNARQARSKTSRLAEILRLLQLHRPATAAAAGAELTFQQYVESGTLARETSRTYHQVFGDYHQQWWDAYFDALARYTEVPELRSIIDEERTQTLWTVGGPDYYRQVPTLPLTVEDWRLFIEFSVLAHTQDFFPSLPSDVYFRQHELMHVSQRRSPWQLQPKHLDKRQQHVTEEDCKRATQYLLPGLVAKRFLSQYVPHSEETRARVTAVVESIRDRYAALIRETEWMDEDTRERAAKKVQSIIVRVVHPNQWEPEPFGDQMDPERYLRNLNIIRRFRVQRNMQMWRAYTEALRKRQLWSHHFDRDAISLFGAPLSTVNAWYSPVTNTITVFAGILRHPFYHRDYDDVSTYAGIGMVIGHGK